MTKPLLDRMADKVLIGDGCWEWIGARIPGGYGAVFDPAHGRQVGAHRAMYELLVGPIPEGLHLGHLCCDPAECPGGACEHRRCVRPDHLEPVTNQSAKTECPNGHPYTPENTYSAHGRSDWRRCKTCTNEQNNRAYARRRKDS